MTFDGRSLAECGAGPDTDGAGSAGFCVDEVLSRITSAAIAGHVAPDGDCLGSTCALYAYIRKHFPDVLVDLYLEYVQECFRFMPGTAEAKNTLDDDAKYDAFFVLDVCTRNRIGVAEDLLDRCGTTVCIDHHRTNEGLCDINVIIPDSSSSCEVLYDTLDHDWIDKDIAASLYTGIVHDTGLLAYTCTSVKTMHITADLMSYGIPFTNIILDTYMMHSLTEVRIQGLALERAELALDGKCAVSWVTPEDMEAYHAAKSDTDGIVPQLRNIRGVSTGVFLYPYGEGYKASLRSAPHVNVGRVAQSFGGGGHIQAAGCSLPMSLEKAKETILAALAKEYERNSESL